MNKSKLIDIYYDLFDYLDEIDMFADALKKICSCKLRKSAIILNLEELRLHHVEAELLQINSMSKEALNNFNEDYTKRRNKARTLYLAGNSISKTAKETGFTNDDIKKMIREENLIPCNKGFYQTTIKDYEKWKKKKKIL